LGLVLNKYYINYPAGGPKGIKILGIHPVFVMMPWPSDEDFGPATGFLDVIQYPASPFCLFPVSDFLMAYYHQVWLVMIFGWITNYLVRSALSPVLIPLMREFSLTYAQAGLLASAFFYAYALMQFPAGYLGDRFGKKRILIL
jgi:hypothetical protein